MMERSRNLFERAQKLIPGGVNSPVRACLSVDSAPVFVERGQGSKLYSVDGREYIDFVESWGPLLLGHAHPAVNKAIHEAVDKGSSFGAPCEDEIRLAEAVVDAVPSIEMVRMVSSGTEATMSALRLARGYTGRNKLIKFEGCYHGHGDAFLASAGSGVATLSIPGTPGVPDTVVADTLLAPYNNLERVKALFENHGADIAAVIVEPTAGNMGLVRPAAGFLQGLRELCDRYGALLIFDEVITGFRLSYGGAQQYFGITPDLTTLGKIIGGGMPVGAYGGRREIMERIAPCGDVYQAGTLAGNPVAMAAGIATLAELKKADYPALEKRVDALASEIEAILKAKGVPVTVNRLASMFTIFFTEEPVTDYDSAKKADGTLYTRFYQQMRDQGIYLAPSGFECAMVSLAHTEDDFAAMLAAVRNVTF
ncbi:MAG: glutamate-1-semialdehyde 2,1-aminomutase [Desulfovibrio alaskensis]|nr:glutamate-1-semialdehyde 2,1-aminomutase [Oleidesulfovibrio alaskensis]MBG0774070.1 glutamate-1-semialdehyde 2,1-aminomutase [Oleidesulfovibrio alaskensis]